MSRNYVHKRTLLTLPVKCVQWSRLVTSSCIGNMDNILGKVIDGDMKTTTLFY